MTNLDFFHNLTFAFFQIERKRKRKIIPCEFCVFNFGKICRFKRRLIIGDFEIKMTPLV